MTHVPSFEDKATRNRPTKSLYTNKNHSIIIKVKWIIVENALTAGWDQAIQKLRKAIRLKKDVNISGMATKRKEQKMGKRQERKCRRFYDKAPTLKEKVDYSRS
jgi:hypothetical protein